MKQESIMKLRQKLKPRLLDYLALEQIPYDAPTLIRCPYCGEQATAYENGEWFCNSFVGCKHSGDVVDYAMAVQEKDEDTVVRCLCRMFGIKNTELDFVTSDEVMDMEFREPVFVVDGLLAKGLILMAGASKIGKSWLALWLAHRISTGQDVWGFETRQCEVMYLCLEDTLGRIQRRLVEVTGGESGTIYLSTQAEIMGCGLEEQLTNFLTSHPNVGAVIIDTLQKVRELKSEQTSYAGDYNAMTRLKTIADKFGVCMIAIHHTRKAFCADPFQRVSGTTGLMGSADTTFILLKDERSGNALKLYGTGRDIPDMELSLQFQKAPMRWELSASSIGGFKPARDLELQQIAQFVRAQTKWQGSATDLTHALIEQSADFEIKPNALMRILNANRNLLEEHYGFCFQTKRVGNGKVVILSTVKPEETGMQAGSERTDFCTRHAFGVAATK